MFEKIMRAVFQPSVRGRIWRSFLFVVILVVVGLMTDAGSYYNRGADWVGNKLHVKVPHVSDEPFHLGLDLQGGSHLVYRADMKDIPSTDRVSALEGVRDVIERRVNAFGVSEPIVQTSVSGDEYRVIVELAGIKDLKKAIDLIGETPRLEFKEQIDKVRELTEAEKKQMEEYNKKAKEKADGVLARALKGEDFAALAKENSDHSSTKETGGDLDWITEGEMPQISKLTEGLKEGEIYGKLNQLPSGYQIIKFGGKRQKTNPFNDQELEKEVKASHLLICYKDSEGCKSEISKEEAMTKIKEIEKEININNFAELAKKYSTDPGAANGGDLGWFGRDAMVKPFADTVFDNQKVGTISYVVETKFGYHLIYKVAERNIDEYKISHILIGTISEQDIIGDEKEWELTELTGKSLEKAMVQFNPNDGSPEIGLQFTKEGADLFEKITDKNVGKPVGIFLDGNPTPISAPNVNEKITGGRAVISGKFTIAEAKELVRYLNAGALPVPIEIVSQQLVGASLGHSSLMMSLKAGLIGLIFVALFMIVYYRLPGVLGAISLLVYGILVLAVFKVWPVTLTLSGIAGFVLSLGMAVDANVLIFERLREELRDGTPFDLALENSFNRAWPSIRDGNLSTLITCLILIWFSTSVIKGFAITLSIGIIVSMFSAIVVTKTFMQLIFGPRLRKHLWLVGVAKDLK